MRLLKNTFLFAVICLGSVVHELYAQQDAQYTHYMYNTLSINPAYAGNRDVLSILGLHRTQWVNFKGAPTTQMLSLHSAVGTSQNIGLGGTIVNDEIGPSRETYVTADFAYRLRLSESYDNRLSFGIKTGITRASIDVSQLDANDTAAQSLTGSINPVIGAGVYYNTDRTYVGVSVPNFFTFDQFKSDDETFQTNRERTHFYLVAGHIVDITDNIKLKPAMMSKMVWGSPLQLDFSLNALFAEKFTAGVAYRLGAAIALQAGYQINDSLFFSVAYDKEATDLGNTQFNDGSYEVMLRFELFRAFGRITTPRFF